MKIVQNNTTTTIICSLYISIISQVHRTFEALRVKVRLAETAHLIL